MLSVGSLFSGIGGFDLGLERTGGFRTAWFCEQDEFCQRVLAKHWPGVPIHPDITRLWAPKRVDVLCGGFPCQDLSYAGRGAGIGGERSGLWTEYARLIRELRPRYVLVENVSALLARGLDVVLGDLAAIGYDAEWDCIPASAVGAPHRRDRIWLVAYPNGNDGRQGRAGRPLAGREGQPEPVRALQELADPERPGPQGHGHRPLRQGPATGSRPGMGDADSLAGPAELSREGRPEALAQPGALERAQRPGGGLGEQWLVEPDVGRVADGVPARVDRLRSLGNALVPQIAEWLGHRVLEHEQEGRIAA